MSTATMGAGAPGSVDALKRVKATEVEWDSRLASARSESEVAVRKLKDESDAALKAAQADADRDRTVAVESGRAQTSREVNRILADGKTAAESAARGEGRRAADKKDAILSVVLGEFGTD